LQPPILDPRAQRGHINHCTASAPESATRADIQRLVPETLTHVSGMTVTYVSGTKCYPCVRNGPTVGGVPTGKRSLLESGFRREFRAASGARATTQPVLTNRWRLLATWHPTADPLPNLCLTRRLRVQRVNTRRFK
jgi:hypothetical protein